MPRNEPIPGDAPTLTADGHAVAPSGERDVRWTLAEETPAALLYNGESFAVMMVSPADLEDFAVGFSLTEGIVRRACEIASVRVAPAHDGFIVNIAVDPADLERAAARKRSIPGRSGCGICGAQTIGAAVPPPPRVAGAHPTAAAVARAIEAFPARQPVNAASHSTHAAAFCRRDGTIERVREDIGRHNALDKLVGALARDGRDARDGFVLLSSRLSVELVYKAAVAGAPFVASLSAPTGLALRTARRAGMGVAARGEGGIVMFDTSGREGAAA
ncbi:MAG: formate dehydrogenase accessory sulfurtransferase FdhD [Alphaproteobacteria bacterium]